MSKRQTFCTLALAFCCATAWPATSALGAQAEIVLCLDVSGSISNPDLGLYPDRLASSLPGKPNKSAVKSAIRILVRHGFLRDDAILVVTIISDANKYSGHLDTDADLQGWYDGLVAAKNGDPTSIVMLGLFPDGHRPDGLCQTGNEKYEQWTDLWGAQGIYGSVCAPDYTPFFVDAVNTIDLTCDDFVPPQG